MADSRMVFYTFLLIALMTAASLVTLAQLPPGTSIAIHFDYDSLPDRWAKASVGLFIVPVLTSVLWLLMSFIPQIDPRGENLARSSGAVGTIWLALTLMCWVPHALVIAASLGIELESTRIFLAALGLAFIAIGNVFGKLRRNSFIGAVTPWTTADERVWDKTQRFTGWLAVSCGFVVLASAIAPVPGIIRVRVLFWVIVALVVLPVRKSYVYWRDRQPELRASERQG